MEIAINQVISDLNLDGIASGLTVTEDSPTGMSVVVSAGTARDQDGQRIRVPSPQTVDVSTDYLGADTSVVGVGNGKWLSLYVEFDRDLQDPRTDGNGTPLSYDRLESFRWKVVQGTESLTPSKPALLTDAILLCDIALTFGQTAVVNANLDTARRMNQLVIAGAPIAINATSILAALTTILSVVNPHIAGSGQFHGADDIQYNGSGLFADGTTSLPATDLETTLDAFVAALAQTSSTPAGDDLIGVRQDATHSPTLAAGKLRDRLTALRLAANHYYAATGSPAWADATALAAGPTEDAITAIVSALASTSGTRGVAKITSPAIAGSPDSLIASTLHAALFSLLTYINARARIASAETITAKYTFDLASPGTGIETASDTTADFNGPVTVDDITATGSNKYKYASRSITRVQRGALHNGSANTWDDGEKVSVAPSEVVEQKLSLPNGQVLTAVTFYHDRNDDPSLPGTSKATGAVYKVNILTGGGPTLIGSVTQDPTTPAASYNAYHGFSVSGLSENVDTSTYRYYVNFTGESGTNQQSTLFYGTTTTVTVTSQDEVAC